MKSQPIAASLIAALALTLSPAFVAAGGRSKIGDPPAIASPIEPPARGVTGPWVLQNFVAQSRMRDAALRQFSVMRAYSLSNEKGHVYADETVAMQFRAPGIKTFSVKSADGSWLIRKLVFGALMDSESQTTEGAWHQRSAIAPENYTFHLLGEQQVGAYPCYLVQATPRRKGKYLFSGKIWISQAHFGIVRIDGSPDRKLSFWVKHVEFVRQYEKLGEFWLPKSDWTLADVRFIGPRIFSIRHYHYQVNGATAAQSAPSH